jgi:molecular chaperone GrpE
VPEQKNPDQAGEGSDNHSIEDAMAEAVASVEARERDASDEPRKGAGEAVTEALIEAKKELESALQQTQKEAESFRDKWLRAAADLENYRKRAQREREEVEKFANEKLLKDLLPVLDDLDRAIGTVSASSDEAKLVAEGVAMVQKKFVAQLDKHGVTTFESVGKAFDPSLHEAVQQVHADVPAGSVANELQRGFLINGRLLRPAMVTVSLGPKPQGEGSAS